MTSFVQRIYQLASDALAERERQVAEIRSRAPALLAAGAIVPSLLAHAIFSGHHRHTTNTVLTIAGILSGRVLL